MIKKLLLVLFSAIALTTALTGCNTTQGAGEDIEEAGEAIQKSAN